MGVGNSNGPLARAVERGLAADPDALERVIHRTLWGDDQNPLAKRVRAGVFGVAAFVTVTHTAASAAQAEAFGSASISTQASAELLSHTLTLGVGDPSASPDATLQLATHSQTSRSLSGDQLPSGLLSSLTSSQEVPAPEAVRLDLRSISISTLSTAAAKGKNVVAIGDSTLEGDKIAGWDRLLAGHGLTLIVDDAKVGRPADDIPALIDQYKSQIADPNTGAVVLRVGTNPGGTSVPFPNRIAQDDALIKKLNPNVQIDWITPFATTSSSLRIMILGRAQDIKVAADPVNGINALKWDEVAAQHPELFGSDGIHERSYTLDAQFEADAVNQLLSAGNLPPVTPTPPVAPPQVPSSPAAPVAASPDNPMSQLSSLLTDPNVLNNADPFTALPFDPNQPDNSPNTLPAGPAAVQVSVPVTAASPPAVAAPATSNLPSGVGETPKMAQLAAAALVVGKNRGTVGQCLAGVEDAFDKVGLSEPRLPSAYMLGDVLAKDSRFREISIPQDQLPQLPGGVVIDWARSSGQPHGHISITLGNGQEASDHVQKQITRYTTAREFVPVDAATPFAQPAPTPQPPAQTPSKPTPDPGTSSPGVVVSEAVSSLLTNPEVLNTVSPVQALPLDAQQPFSGGSESASPSSQTPADPSTGSNSSGNGVPNLTDPSVMAIDVTQVLPLDTNTGSTSTPPAGGAQQTPGASHPSPTPTPTPSPTPSPVPGDDLKTTLVKYFLGQGFNLAQDAGIMGNIQAESGIQPERLQNTRSGVQTPAQSLTPAQLADKKLGWGLVQDTPPGKVIQHVTGDPNDPMVQATFLIQQLHTNESNALRQILATSTPEGAAYAFEKYFERPQTTSDAPTREAFARAIYNEMVKKGVTPTPAAAPVTPAAPPQATAKPATPAPAPSGRDNLGAVLTDPTVLNTVNVVATSPLPSSAQQQDNGSSKPAPATNSPTPPSTFGDQKPADSNHPSQQGSLVTISPSGILNLTDPSIAAIDPTQLLPLSHG